MARYNDGTRYNSGAVYGPQVAAVTKVMARVKMNVSKLSAAQRLIRSAEVQAMSASNPNVPGNGPVLAELATAQTALQAALLACEEARNIAKQRTAECHAAMAAWMTAMTNVASFTQSATGGDAGKILSAGFEVCNPPTPLPVPPLVAVSGVTAALNGQPGHSVVSWNPVPGADGYLVQGSPDPFTATSWLWPEIAMTTRCECNGANPGQKYWYRVAAFNASGQGPWSSPTERPVM